MMEYQADKEFDAYRDAKKLAQARGYAYAVFSPFTGWAAQADKPMTRCDGMRVIEVTDAGEHYPA